MESNQNTVVMRADTAAVLTNLQILNVALMCGQSKNEKKRKMKKKKKNKNKKEKKEKKLFLMN